MRSRTHLLAACVAVLGLVLATSTARGTLAAYSDVQIAGPAQVGAGTWQPVPPPECAEMSFTTVVEGTGGDDYLRLDSPGSGAYLVFGYGGNDVIYGGNNDDCLVGGDGDDQLFGTNGQDVLIAGNGGDLADGGNGTDSLYGGDGDDTLLGQNAPDVVDGGAGIDTCSGGNGPDTFVNYEIEA